MTAAALTPYPAASASARRSSVEHSHSRSYSAGGPGDEGGQDARSGELFDAFRAFESFIGGPEADADLIPRTAPAQTAAEPESWEADLAHTGRIIVMAERLAIFAAAVLSGCAIFAAKIGGLPVHPVSLAGWGAAACISAMCLAAVATDRTRVGPGRVRHAMVNATLVLALLCSLTGAVTAADGVAGPAWVLFLPVVVITGAVGGVVPGLVTGAGAAAGVYAAAAISSTLSIAGLGRLVLILPVFPAIGAAVGALCGEGHRAARDARQQQAALHADVIALSELLDAVASGDLAAPPTVPVSLIGGGRSWSDPATEGLAVVLADTLVALRRLVARLSGAGDQVLTAADELASTATVHLEAVETQATAVTETTTTIEQLASTAVGIAEVAGRVSECAADSRADVRDGIAAVERVAESAGVLGRRTAGLAEHATALQAAVDRIGKATKVMDELSRRTSMLALSAAIEAAAAKEHSAGFGHVAGEVRSLAERARAATARIETIVDQLRDEVAATGEAARYGAMAVTVGVERQRDVEAALARISHMIDMTSDAAEEIGSATRQQQVAANAVVQAMASVEAASTQARVATERHSESAQRLRDLAAEVRDTIARFRLPRSSRSARRPLGDPAGTRERTAA